MRSASVMASGAAPLKTPETQVYVGVGGSLRITFDLLNTCQLSRDKSQR